MFSNFYEGKRVLVTGHTGFKGSWLCNWLVLMGADVAGFSDGVKTKPSLFEISELEKKIAHYLGDIRDEVAVAEVFEKFQPDVVFHLAAQAIVSTSYDDPLGTITTNALGTANICGCLLSARKPIVCVLVTSDKCYENVEWEFGYRELDKLGGKDPYSASKACAEILFNSYFHSFLKDVKGIKIASARAGNVIGGGDWSKDRIVVDMIEAWSSGHPVEIRSPDATRPWQHVLEPLSGYLLLAKELGQHDGLNGQSFNFGPRSEQNHTVLTLASDIFAQMKGDVDAMTPYRVTDNKPFHEAGLLKLSCDKALFHLMWEPTLKYEDCVEFVGSWYAKNLAGSDMEEITTNQINQYILEAKKQGQIWTK